ncbi:MAG TPA: protein-L-isoaspartate(D-aspartate) O-methyltransferase [Candidatus Omnitrophota bacterium]|mgnify:CR=1 FL=1|nr:protein-L-isoaspartate(D-aspartate) O-methyltransferase [Candidatus Omnitrophota bacterium]
MNYQAFRLKMVEDQIVRRGIKDKRVLEAMRHVERDRFVPENEKSRAYNDYPLPIGSNQTISQPYIVALMTELLELTGNEKVLEIGTGSGYQTAILSELAGSVFTIERIPELANRAKSLLQEIGYGNIHIRNADGSLGWEEEAPFDRIIITAAAPDIPAPLAAQLAEGGILVYPRGQSFQQEMTVAKRIKGKIESGRICSCVFVPLIGKYGLKNV